MRWELRVRERGGFYDEEMRRRGRPRGDVERGKRCRCGLPGKGIVRRPGECRLTMGHRDRFLGLGSVFRFHAITVISG